MKRDLLSIKDLKPKELPDLFSLTDECREGKHRGVLSEKIMASLFFEPSTRTRLSFESAMIRLGGKIIGFQEPSTSSFSKGESLSDTIRVVSEYADLIVLRHPHVGAAHLAAKVSSRPVINAGDGSSEHPTQTLIDLYTIEKLFGRLKGLKVALLGDLRYARTVQSLCKGIAPFSPRLFFLSPPEFAVPEKTLEELKENEVKFSFHASLDEVIAKLDLLYVVRPQKERHPHPEKPGFSYRLTLRDLEKAPSHLKIMHPLPRTDEIAEEIDATSFQAYFEQAKQGLFVREALCMRFLCPN